MSSSDATPLQVPSPQQLSSQFSQIARQLEPAVVNINTESTIKNPHLKGGRAVPGAPDDNDGGDDNTMQDFLDRFFGGQGGQGGQGQAPGGPGGEDMRERSLGSGVIVDAKGYILTNAHVVEKGRPYPRSS